MWALGPEVHPALLQLCVAGFQGAAVLLPQHSAEHVHLVRQQGQLVEGSDGAPQVDLSLRDPSEVAQIPQFYVYSRETRQNHTVEVSWFGKPLSKILFHISVVTVNMLKWVWLSF